MPGRKHPRDALRGIPWPGSEPAVELEVHVAKYINDFPGTYAALSIEVTTHVVRPCAKTSKKIPGQLHLLRLVVQRGEHEPEAGKERGMLGCEHRGPGAAAGTGAHQDGPDQIGGNMMAPVLSQYRHGLDDDHLAMHFTAGAANYPLIQHGQTVEPGRWVCFAARQTA